MCAARCRAPTKRFPANTSRGSARGCDAEFSSIQVSPIVFFSYGLPTLPRFSAPVCQKLHSLFSSALNVTERAIVRSTSTDGRQEEDIAPLVVNLKLWCVLISLRTWISNIGKIHVEAFRNNFQPVARCSSPKACGAHYKEDNFLWEN